MLRLSVVIPTLNEADELSATLRHAAAVPEVGEIVVSDGGSTDGTEALVRASGARWLPAPAGRGCQLRAGAAVATGDVVVLLHADTWLPDDAGQAIARALELRTLSNDEGREIVGGGFHKIFRDGPWLLRSTARWRCAAYFRICGRFFGDQAIFIRRDTLEAIGGVPDLPLMEEFALCRRLVACGRLILIPATVSTSGRSFERTGVLRTWWLMWSLQRAWARGTPPAELARRYRHCTRPD